MIVEDDPFIAIDLEDAYLEAGFEVMGPFVSSESALAALAARDTAPDVATLDYNLTDGTSRPVASMLAKLGVPFLMVTSEAEAVRHRPFCKGRPVFPKPFDLPALVGHSAALATA